MGLYVWIWYPIVKPNQYFYSCIFEICCLRASAFFCLCFKLYFILHVYMLCPHVCLCIMRVSGGYGDQKRVSGPRELEYRQSWAIGCYEQKTCPVRQRVFSNYWTISSSPSCLHTKLTLRTHLRLSESEAPFLYVFFPWMNTPGILELWKIKKMTTYL